jgi:cytochrome c
MKFQYVPNDIPLPLPTGGLAFLDYTFVALLVASWLVHILFINVLLGASLSSVYFNYVGHKAEDKSYDRAAYLLTTPVTISENMGALWGVAPLLLVSILYTPLFYSASVMNSPHWLYIIYGNIVAFLISYLYKFTWSALKEHKALHIFLGATATLIFYTLPFVFMATSQLYMTPSTWTQNTHFWDALLRPDTLWRLVHFFLGTFAVSGAFMFVYGAYKRRNAEDRAAGEILVRTGRAWFLVSTGLNFFAGALVLFHFPNYGQEGLFQTYYPVLIAVTVLASLLAMALLIKGFFNDSVAPSEAWRVAALAFVAVASMATLRHGVREALTAPAMAQSRAGTQQYVAQVENFRKTAAARPTPEAPKFAAAGEALADKNGCLACHSASQKLVGPAYKDVAAKGYKVSEIMALVRNPKPANWPGFPEMPAMPDAPDNELKQIAEWIISLKP